MSEHDKLLWAGIGLLVIGLARLYSRIMDLTDRLTKLEDSTNELGYEVRRLSQDGNGKAESKHRTMWG